MQNDCMGYQQFLETHQLSDTYLTQADRCFSSPVENLLTRSSNSIPIIGINDCQGSGKTTLAPTYTLGCNLSTIEILLYYLWTIVISTDSSLKYYRKIFTPLLKTRGVPGTHNITRAIKLLSQLRDGKLPVSLPRFGKARDDTCPKSQWKTIEKPVDIIILEGWCLGATAQTEQQINTPINELGCQYDADGRWRSFVNQQLTDDYHDCFSLVDCWVMLKAPSFESVFQWRLEQEQKLASIPGSARNNQRLMDATQIWEFIQHFERLTRHMLNKMPNRISHLYELDEHRHIVDQSHHDTISP